MNAEISIDVKEIHKSFSSVKVLKGVSLEVFKGEAHAIVGENGAGKSTLMNIISGDIPAAKGGIFLDGEEVHFKNPDDAQRAGIGFVHQELALCPHVTVADNIFIHRLPVKNGLVDYKKLNEMAAKALEPFNTSVKPDQKVSELSVAERYGALLWSGDVHSTFESFRRQFAAGLNAGISGIPWWTTDIGGFTGGDPEKPEFRELLVRWFQFGVFCPVCRLHGFRFPIDFDIEDAMKKFNEPFGSGGNNEIWSYGEEVYNILKGCLFTRERLRPYITEQMKKAHKKGTPIIRPLFYDFPDQKECWNIEDQYMFGPDISCPRTACQNEAA